MAVELDKFIKEQLKTLPANHPDRKFLRGISATAQAYINSSAPKAIETVYVKAMDVEENIRIGNLINDTFLGSLPDSTPLADIRNHFVETIGLKNDRRARVKVEKGPYSDKWEEIYKGLSSSQKNVVTRTFAAISRAGERGLRFYRYSQQGDEYARTLGELRSLPNEDYLRIDNIGHKSVALLTSAIARR